MDRYVNDLIEIARSGGLALIVGSKIPENPYKILQEEILSFLSNTDPAWHSYVQEIRQRKIPTETFLRLLYLQLHNNIVPILQSVQLDKPGMLHRQLARLIREKKVGWLAMASIDQRLSVVLREQNLQVDKDFYTHPQPATTQLPLIFYCNGVLTQSESLIPALTVMNNNFSAITPTAELFFREVYAAKAILVLGVDRQEYCWRGLYGNLLSLAKKHKPVYWVGEGKGIALEHLLAVSSGGLLSESGEKILHAIGEGSLQEIALADKPSEPREFDLPQLRAQLQKINELEWLYFLASLLKAVSSNAHSCTLFEQLSAVFQQKKNYVQTALCQRNMGEIWSGRGCVEKAIKCHIAAIDFWAMGKDESNLANESILVGDNYCTLASFDKAVQYFGEALSLYRYCGNQQGIMDITTKLALLCEEDGDYELAKQYYSESLQAAKTLKNDMAEARTLISFSSTLMKDKEWEVAQKYLQEALDICEKRNDVVYKGEIYQHLGLVYMNLQDYQTARHYYEKAYDLYKEENEQLSLTFVYCNLGHVCARLGDYDAAVKYYEDALESYEKMGDWQHLAAVYNNLGLINSNRNDYTLAEEYFSRAAEIFAALQDVYNLIRTYNNLARIYTLQEEMENAAECYHANIEMLTQLGEQEDLAATLVALAMVQLKTQQLQGAVSHLEQAANLYDSLGMKQEREETRQIIQTIENNIMSSSS
jgi:tetratricopeptide (TPR) repeat protein